jgi:DNA polymerase III subunit delta
MSLEAAGSALKAYLDEREAGAARPNAFFVIEAGDLKASQSLRKAAEGSALVGAIACYPDTEASLEGLVDEMLSAAGARIEPDAKAALMDRLGSDRGISRQEIDKLLTYCGATAATPATVRLGDVLELVGDSAAVDIERLIDAVFNGDQPGVARIGARLATAGTQPVRILRAVAVHLDRLTALESGGRGAGYGYYQNDSVRRHAARWSPHLIARAQSLVIGAEIRCKTTGLPAEEICERLMLALAKGAGDAPVT